ncbi:hypothetical protein [Proteus phage PM2]|uniref:Site-specific RNA endonuclease n=1 Tax=Proteus phage PM2 TaxID=2025809 RepID=A0A249XWR2_9CAUD|nr:endoribonuclease [Proteus phage PM2]ASZ76362.1 hypothetical protein [Proteus phage PM2]
MNIHVERAKARRKFSEAFSEINKNLNKENAGFHIKFGSHIIDRTLERGIQLSDIFGLLNKLYQAKESILDYCKLPDMPIENPDPNIEYKPTRLEITDGKLWIGFTSSEGTQGTYGLTCRMVIFNPSRLPSKISTKVIKF